MPFFTLFSRSTHVRTLGTIPVLPLHVLSIIVSQQTDSHSQYLFQILVHTSNNSVIRELTIRCTHTQTGLILYPRLLMQDGT